ncbi:MFS transporter [Roseomonas sp. 18066]|uniref:MFS transporter n=1 Tax=Roseomonas sp. 18066 TaxID=2681412 RepID=UPI00135A9091|nr:MFS transporter [Roseomonas sp. 18066]
MSSTSVPCQAAPLPRPAFLLFGAATLAVVQAASAAPTPLYRLYQEAWGLSALAVTGIFAIYSASLLLALLTVGSLSDQLGRRPVIAAALLLDAGAMLVFMTAGSVEALLAARLVQGFATGAAMSSLGAAILDGDRQRGPLVNAVTPLLGLTLGTLGTALLVAQAPAPRQLVFLILGAAMLVAAVLVWALPETARRDRSVTLWKTLRPRLGVPPQARAVFWAVMPVNVAVWALGGFYFSLMPAVARQLEGGALLGGLVVATLTAAGSLAMLALRGMTPARILPLGSAALAGGTLATLAAVALASPAGLLLGTALAGFGFGGAFFGAARSLLPLAAPHQRAGLLSAFYVESYLAFSLPALAAGMAAREIGLLPTTQLYGGAVVLLALLPLLRRRRMPR